MPRDSFSFAAARQKSDENRGRTGVGPRFSAQYQGSSTVTEKNVFIIANAAYATDWYDLLHLATHGFFLDGRCSGTGVAGESPLLRSGLAFAGANHRRESFSATEDGILTAEEVAVLPLEGTEWVVLSGCDTGIGDIQAGEGVLGLRRAFQEAGARTLIASLWPVDDEETRRWMTTLYRARFLRGQSTAQSLRHADLSRIRARRAAGKSTHPFYWAGFIATSDWR